MKPSKRLKKAVCTWMCQADYDKFVAIARGNHLTPSAYLRGIVVDIIAEEMAAPPTVPGGAPAQAVRAA